jgi:hypothetical protein
VFREQPVLRGIACVKRQAIVGKNEFGDPEIAATNHSSDHKALLVWLGGSALVNVVPAANSLARLRIIKHSIFAWRDDDLISYLSIGHAAGHGTASGPMGEAVDHSFSRLAPEDIRAVVAYLRAVPPMGPQRTFRRRWRHLRPPRIGMAAAPPIHAARWCSKAPAAATSRTAGRFGPWHGHAALEVNQPGKEIVPPPLPRRNLFRRCVLAQSAFDRCD